MKTPDSEALVSDILTNHTIHKPEAAATSPFIEPLKLVTFDKANRLQDTLDVSEYILDSPISELIRWRINCLDDGDAFYVADLGVLERQLKRWQKLLPRIEPFYAVKCNPDPMVLKKMVALNVGFDCASKTEIQTMLDLGVSASRIIYANPCKQSSFIKYAAGVDVKMMTFDNGEELHKIKKFFPSSKLVLRIITDDSDAVCRLSAKFGAPLDITGELLQLAKELELDVVGVSFHVGSGCQKASSFRDAVLSARKVFDEGLALGFDMKILDVGGGFPGGVSSPVSFEEIAAVLGKAVDEFFPSEVRVIAEPGRFFVASAFELAVNVTARRSIASQSETNFMYYVNDGVYGSFNCILFDHAVVKPLVLTQNEKFFQDHEEHLLFKSSVWGPTCDSMDLINKETLLPKLEVGDWILYKEMGAYTCCASSTFNGFKKSQILYTCTSI
jgi:ornithine decarboxylase